ncbi:hypothetical protein BGZ60DRAFT_525666 [Tricladium varicosporioides]|nr:hypothetical protein BGZ60DRAFT_525666 [Hymenoscyphus varicosporioides]
MLERTEVGVEVFDDSGLGFEDTEPLLPRTVTKVDNIVRIGFDEVSSDEERAEEERKKLEIQGEFKMAYLWVEGWRARLRAGGDIVEKARGGWYDRRTEVTYVLRDHRKYGNVRL